jgi:DnaJ-class molecular chaperone
MTHDGLDSAYATLGLRRGASAVAVKRRYRALVRQWHPDQFASDPQGVMEATLMLKAVNRAYKTIVEHRAPDVVGAAPARPQHVSQQSTRAGASVTSQ